MRKARGTVGPAFGNSGRFKPRAPGVKTDDRAFQAGPSPYLNAQARAEMEAAERLKQRQQQRTAQGRYAAQAPPEEDRGSVVARMRMARGLNPER
jgi:hypothetical protein